VLLVEADPEAQRLLVDMLATAGQTVHPTGDLAHGVAIAQTVRPDLVVLGWTGGTASGLYACWRLRRVTQAPILVMEPCPDTPGDYAVLEVVRDESEPRLLSLPQLISRATFGPSRRPGRHLADGAPDRQRVGAVTLDRPGRRFLVRDVEVRLTAKEFDLLSFLMAHPGRVHSLDSLLTHVWGDRLRTPNRKTVMVHVRWLREKLAGQQDLRIVTVRGAGYRLDLDPAVAA
jgi:DNA-binding response OmpR family regulator